jgi:hypothetical protein
MDHMVAYTLSCRLLVILFLFQTVSAGRRLAGRGAGAARNAVVFSFSSDGGAAGYLKRTDPARLARILRTSGGGAGSLDVAVAARVLDEDQSLVRQRAARACMRPNALYMRIYAYKLHGEVANNRC